MIIWEIVKLPAKPGNPMSPFSPVKPLSPTGPGAPGLPSKPFKPVDLENGEYLRFWTKVDLLFQSVTIWICHESIYWIVNHQLQM